MPFHLPFALIVLLLAPIASGAVPQVEGIASAIVALVALSAMEIVLGIDNIVFISIVTAKLPEEKRSAARRIGLGLALMMRICLLFAISTVMQLTDPILSLSEWMPIPETKTWLAETSQQAINEVSVRDLILLVGGLFLMAKSVKEIHGQVEGHHDSEGANFKRPTFLSVLIQITLLDIIFSLDSVITAVGMVDQIWIMIASVILAIIVMMIFANQIATFVEHNPTIKMLALAFLIMIGIMLVADGLGTHFSKGYVYFAMVFALLVEMLNIRMRRKTNKKDVSQPAI